MNTRKIVKIFFFKNFFQYFDNYSNFNDYVWKNTDFPFRNEYLDLNGKENTKINYILEDHLILMNNFEDNYLKKYYSFENLKNNNFNTLNQFIDNDLIQNNGLDLLFCLFVNHLFSYYYSNEKENNNEKIKILKNEFNNIIKNNK